MKSSFPLFAALSLLIAAAPVVALHAEPGSVQNEMRQAIGSRNVLPPKVIEAKVLPMMQGMQYLGPEYDPVAMAYRLKFIQNGRVVFVDVDARNGRIIGEQR
jgi:hypothetical protein